MRDYEEYLTRARASADEASKILSESSHPANSAAGQAWATLALAYAALAERYAPGRR